MHPQSAQNHSHIVASEDKYLKIILGKEVTMGDSVCNTFNANEVIVEPLATTKEEQRASARGTH